jgi:hypothetical protein
MGCPMANGLSRLRKIDHRPALKIRALCRRAEEWRLVGSSAQMVLVIAGLLGFRVPFEADLRTTRGVWLSAPEQGRLQWRDRAGLSPASTPRVDKANDIAPSRAVNKRLPAVRFPGLLTRETVGETIGLTVPLGD